MQVAYTLEPIWFTPPRTKLNTALYKDSPSPPPAPDYTAAANATASGNLDAARAAAAANRINQYTPYGNLTYSHDASQGADAGWSATQTLSPAQQAIQDQNNQLNLGLQSTANRGLTYANDVLSKPGVDTSQLAQTGINPGQSYQDAMMSRLQPQIERENQQSDAQLANQGIAQGTEAYRNAKTALSQQHNDLMNNATVQGFNTGLAANNQGFQQQAYNQMQPINVINALRTGSQVQNPNFVNAPQQATTAGADLLGAANQQYGNALSGYNAQQANNNNFTGGLMQLGGTLGSAMLFSDERLKTNIKRIGTHDKLGIGIYYYEKFGKPEIGVLAQEVQKVKPEAVHKHESGYLMVDYGEL